MNAWTTFEEEALPHVDRLFRFGMRLERDRAEAEDLVQETLIQALQSFHRFVPGTNCRAWLMSILRHVRGSRLRSRGRLPVVADNDMIPHLRHELRSRIEISRSCTSQPIRAIAPCLPSKRTRSRRAWADSRSESMTSLEGLLSASHRDQRRV
jgi:RNA polymerase sigma factor (sigma-70 family)